MRRAAVSSLLPTRRLALGQKLVTVSWNILCPSLKPIGGDMRESNTDEWLARVQKQIDYLREINADIVGLQEFWTSNPAFVSMWRDFADAQGYHMLISPRVSSKRADGLCMLVRNEIEMEMGCLDEGGLERHCVAHKEHSPPPGFKYYAGQIVRVARSCDGRVTLATVSRGKRNFLQSIS